MRRYGSTGVWLRRAATVALLWLLGGSAGLLLGLVIVVADLLRPLPPRLLMLTASLGLLALPLVVLARGLPSRATLTPDFAAGSLLPHVLAGTSLALLVLGILRDVRASLPPAPPPEPAPPALASRPAAAALERGGDAGAGDGPAAR